MNRINEKDGVSMEIKHVLDEFSMINRKDPTGKIVRTEVYKLENGIFQAVSYYYTKLDEGELVGVGKSANDLEAIKRSRKHLKMYSMQNE